jgi:hypothetical protein
MTSEYIKQLEEANSKLENLVETLDDKCQWLEKLRSFRVSTSWNVQSTYQIGINNYKNKREDGKFNEDGELIAPKDVKLKKVFEDMSRDVVAKYLTSVDHTDKITVNNTYNAWRNSFPAFVCYAGHIMKSKRYSYIDKLSFNTEVEIELMRLNILSDAIFPIYDVKKSICQAASIIIKRNGDIPKVSVILKKRLYHGSPNKVSFMGFEKHIREYSNIFQKIKNMNIK